MDREVIPVGVPVGGRISPRGAVLLVGGILALVVGVAVAGGEASHGTPRIPPAASHAALASPSSTPVPTPRRSDGPVPTPACVPAGTTPLTTPIARHPAPLRPTGLATLIEPSSSDGKLVVDGRATVWSFGSGRLGRLDRGGHLAAGWTVADDARFDATDIVAAKEGGVWLYGDAYGSSGSIAWFDGARFRDVIRAPGPVSSVAEAPDGSIWAASYISGLFHWDGSSWTAVCAPTPGGVDRVVVDGQGNAWITQVDVNGTVAGISRYDGRQWTSYPHNIRLVRALAVGPDGTPWVVDDCDLSRFDGAAWKTVDPGCIDEVADVVSLSADDIGAWIVAGTRTWDDGLTASGMSVERFDGTSWQMFDAADGLPTATRGSWSTIFSVVSSPGGVLAATRRGLYRLDGAEWTRVEGRSAPQSVASLVVGPSDGALVATYGDGIWEQRGGTWRRANPPGASGAWGRVARGPGDVVAVASETILAVRRGSSWSILGTFEAGQGVSGLAFAPDGTLWAWYTPPAGLLAFRFDGTAWRSVAVPQPSSMLSGATIVFDGHGPWLVGGGWVPMIQRLVDGSWTDVTVGDDWKPTGSAVVGADGRVWIPVWQNGSAAIAAFDGAEWRTYPAADVAPSNWTPMDIAAAPDGSIVAVGGSGIVRFDGQRWSTILEGHWFDHVAVGRDGSILVSGSPGIIRFPPPAG